MRLPVKTTGAQTLTIGRTKLQKLLKGIEAKRVNRRKKELGDDE